MKELIQLNDFGPKDFFGTTHVPVLYIKCDRLVLNKKGIDLTGFQENDTIKIAQDKKDPDTWYMYKDPNGFSLKRTNRSKSLAIYSQGLCDTIKKSFESDEDFPFYINKESINQNDIILWKITAEEETEEK